MLARRPVLSLLALAAIAGASAGSIGVLARARPTAQANPEGEPLGLKGYDPVAYFTVGTPTAGLAEYDYVYDGVRYLFASAKNRDLFKADPEKYAPQFGGNCANNMSNGVRRESDPTVWLIIGGKLYVFAGPAGAQRFAQHPQAAAIKAAETWKSFRSMVSQ
ncbi:YHS domain-containing (seleno)protein [Reyranella sp.]|uniref:YHS domain-containing (seleno)protein n=1 Tax=Reyranella sp. TaxID=1929291 RepID=UPI003BABE09C